MKSPLIAVAIALFVSATQSPVHTQSSPSEYVPGEIIIAFEPEATVEQRAEARSWVRGARRELLKRRRHGAGDVELAAIAGESVEQALANLRYHPAVRYAEPNWIYRSFETSNDPHFASGAQWGMYSEQGVAPTMNQFGSQAVEAWAAGHVGSASVVVGVIDKGIQILHPDLRANIWTNRVEATGVPGVDDDGNGYIDDFNGWDFLTNDNTVYDGAFDDHGTHVAGTIGAKGGNGAGVAGVNWNVTMVPVKIINSAGTGTNANAIKALDYLTDLKSRHGLNLVATNNSWGGGPFSQTLLDAIVRSASADILFVAAAGNNTSNGGGLNNDVTPFYPANYDTTAGAGYDAVISVANITIIGTRAASSNFGKTMVDLGAPGTNILSTNPTNTYANLSGTSMAAAHVTGAAALYASLLPHVTARRIKEVILDAAAATPTPSLTDMTVTGGRLNIGEFAAAPPPLPAAPGDLAVVPISSSETALTWNDHASDEDGFTIERCDDTSCSSARLLAYVDADVIRYQDAGLLENTQYRYRVSAFNRGGASASNVAEAATLPVIVAQAGTGISVDEGQPVTLDGTLSSHENNAPLTFAWTQTAGPAVMLAGADTSQPTFTAPQVVALETLTFSLTVTDGERSATDTVDVTVLNVNQPPAITSLAELTATEDVLYSYAATAIDADGPGLTWSVVADDLSCGGTIDPTSGIYSFTPAGPAPPASCVVSIQVCDGGEPNLCSTQTATIVVAAVNDPPAVTAPADITTTATSAAGATVSFTAAGSDPEDGSITPVCTPPSDSVFPIAATTVTCTVTDSDGAAVSASFTVTVTDPAEPGEMRGEGFIRDEDAKYEFQFLARERASGAERARLSVRIDEHGGKKKGKKRDDRFESRSVDFMMFSDDPTIWPGRTPRPQVDTVLFSGTGVWNGDEGYRYEVFAQDVGEPGRHRESIRVTISDSAGTVVAAFSGELDGGNIQSVRLRRRATTVELKD